MRKPLFFPICRSGNEWLVKAERDVTSLNASVGDDPTIPPITGWKFWNFDFDIYEHEEDPDLTCKVSSASSSCSITVSLKGLAREIQGECEGDYKETGLRSAGRKVHFNTILCSLSTN